MSTGSEPFLQQSDHEAFLWAERAAKRALPKAEYAVGCVTFFSMHLRANADLLLHSRYYYEVGIGVGVNVEKAKQWYMRASGASCSVHKRLAVCAHSQIGE